MTFDGDVTLYEDGGSLVYTNPVIPYILKLLRCGINVGIVAAAGYDEAGTYENRLKGLIVALHDSTDIPVSQKQNLTIMGGESSYLFRYYEDPEEDNFGFRQIDKEEWLLPKIKAWSLEDVEKSLDFDD